MIQYGNGGWQTTIADLALILFMVSVAALADRPDLPDGDGPAAEMSNPLPAFGEPVAIYRPGAGITGIGAWLTDQAPDPRQQLTVIARYTAGQAVDAAADALALAEDARAAGREARIVLEPSVSTDLVAMLGYDSASGVEGNEWHDDCLDPAMRGIDAASKRNGPCE